VGTRADPGRRRSAHPQGGGAPGGEDEGEGEALMRDEILAEQFTRNVQFFGRDAQARIAGSFVVVVGLGGVGSHAANLLLRSGVSRLRLVDFDQVTLSSLNRHAVAVREDVGTPKALCMVKHFNRVFPEAILEPLVSLYEPVRSCLHITVVDHMTPESRVVYDNCPGSSGPEPEMQSADARLCHYRQDTEDAVLGGSPDFVIDAIDNIDTKVAVQPHM
jgi:tRNA A37 threonylcarbamoyladenosine dehydratase